MYVISYMDIIFLVMQLNPGFYDKAYCISSKISIGKCWTYVYSHIYILAFVTVKYNDIIPDCQLNVRDIDISLD